MNELIGLGVLFLCGIMSYLLYQIARFYQQIADTEERYNVFEQCLLDKVAAKKGIDINKEIMKQSIFKKSKHNIRSRLRQEMYEEMFGKENKR